MLVRSVWNICLEEYIEFAITIDENWNYHLKIEGFFLPYIKCMYDSDCGQSSSKHEEKSLAIPQLHGDMAANDWLEDNLFFQTVI